MTVLSLLKRLGVAVGLLIGANVALWFAFGDEALRRALPSMARADLEMSGGRVPYECDPSIFSSLEETWAQRLRSCIQTKNIRIVCEGDLAPLNPNVMRELRAALVNYGLAAHFETDHCPPFMGGGMDMGCLDFHFTISKNTPLLAEVYAHQFVRSGGSSVFVHWRLWFFGVWLPLSDRFSGQE